MKTNAHVYIMRAEDGSLKLGHSIAPTRRAKELDRPVEIVHQTDVVEQAERIERLAHRVLALHGKHIRGEWFEAKLEDALLAIEIATRQAESAELALGGFFTKPPAKPPKYPNVFLMRTDDAFDQALDDLRHLERPVLSRSDYLRKLVFDAHAEAVRAGKLEAR